MVAQGCVSLREAADELGLESVRLLRLGRYLRLAPGDRCIPLDVIVRVEAEADGEKRYRMVLKWLLDHLQSDGTSDNEPSLRHLR